MTNNKIFERESPYERFVLDCDLNINQFWFKGILVFKGWAWTYYGESDGFCDDFLLFTIFDEEGTKIDTMETIKKERGTIVGAGSINNRTLKKLRTFICNFLDFLNNPEVRIIRIKRSQKNIERRIRQGKEPLPSSNKIKINGTLRTYYDKLGMGARTLSHRFWVRGHFMRFWNKKRFANLYKLMEQGELPSIYYVDDRIRKNDKIITIWKKPFIKGSGVLVSKKYKLEKRR